jgi:hypothetical protein
VTHVMTPAASTFALPERALRSDLFNGWKPAGVHASRIGVVVPRVVKLPGCDEASAAS